MKRNEIKKLALSALLCALSTVITVIGCVFDILDLTACAVACAAVAFAVQELRGKYPYLIYAVTSVLSVIFFPSASATIYFVVFFGYYPIIKSLFERLPRLASRILKFAVFNAAAVVIFMFAKALFISPDARPDKLLIFVLWLFANVFFAVFDLCLSVIMTAYMRYYRHKWGIDKFLGSGGR